MGYTNKYTSLFISLICFIVLFFSSCLFNSVENQERIYPARYGIKDGDSYSVIDELGNIVIENLNTTLLPRYSDGLAIIKYEEDNLGFIDVNGEVLLKVDFENISRFHDGMARVSSYTFRDGGGLIGIRNGFIDKSGNLVINFLYSNARLFHQGLASVENDEGQKGYINQEGDVVIDLIYDYAFDFRDGYAIVAKDDVYYCIDQAGEVIFESPGGILRDFGDEVYSVSLDHYKYGYVDMTGKFIMDRTFSFTTRFYEGRAVVGELLDDDFVCPGFFIIDKTGAPVTDESFDRAGGIQHGYFIAWRRDEDTPYIYDKEGNMISQLPIPIESGTIDEHLIVTFTPEFDLQDELPGNQGSPWYMKVDGTVLWEPKD